MRLVVTYDVRVSTHAIRYNNTTYIISRIHPLPTLGYSPKQPLRRLQLLHLNKQPYNHQQRPPLHIITSSSHVKRLLLLMQVISAIHKVVRDVEEVLIYLSCLGTAHEIIEPLAVGIKRHQRPTLQHPVSGQLIYLLIHLPRRLHLLIMLHLQQYLIHLNIRPNVV